MQFTMMAEVNRWNFSDKAFHLAASLRRYAADAVGSATFSKTLKLRFREKRMEKYRHLPLKSLYQKVNETLPELATSIKKFLHFGLY